MWSVAWSPDGQRLAAGGVNRTLQIRHIADSASVNLNWTNTSVTALAWSFDSAWLAVGTKERKVLA
jgi:WD40 repeat protein